MRKSTGRLCKKRFKNGNEQQMRSPLPPTAERAARQVLRSAQNRRRMRAGKLRIRRQRGLTARRAAPSAVGGRGINKKTGAFQFPRTGHDQLPD